VQPTPRETKGQVRGVTISLKSGTRGWKNVEHDSVHHRREKAKPMKAKKRKTALTRGRDTCPWPAASNSQGGWIRGRRGQVEGMKCPRTDKKKTRRDNVGKDPIS